MTFNELALDENILSSLKKKGYLNPTPIQEKAIPHVLNGDDLFGCAQTGTGKTAAFALPILQLLYQRKEQGVKPGIKALILAPTRELALQISENFGFYGANTGLRHTVIFGGVSQKPQTDALRRGIDILIATPGRLQDLMQQGFIKLNSVEIFVLDEADRMLDMGFVNDIKRIVPKLPAKRQTLFFSATVAPAIRKLADTMLNAPVSVSTSPVASTAETVGQSVYFVSKENKPALLQHLLRNDNIDHVLVFTRTKHGANKVEKALNKIGVKAVAIHGNKSQNARQNALKGFKDRSIRVLVATDIASRGIDVDKLSHVINYDLPNEPESYVHRIGRTGRAGRDGEALSFCDAEEVAYLRDIQKLIKVTIPVVSDHPYAETFTGNEPKSAGKSGAENRSKGTKKPFKRNFQRNRPHNAQKSSGAQIK